MRYLKVCPNCGLNLVAYKPTAGLCPSPKCWLDVRDSPAGAKARQAAKETRVSR